jgi:hypothetical protein
MCLRFYTTGLTLVGFFLALSAAIYAKKSCYTTVSCVSQDWSVVRASIGAGLCYWTSLTCNHSIWTTL